MTTTPSRQLIEQMLSPERPRHPETDEPRFLTTQRQIPAGATAEDLLAILIGLGDEIVARLGNQNAWTVNRVPVATAGTPQQGPNQTIPQGFALTVRFRKPSSGSPTGYVATTPGFTGDASSRIELPPNGSVTLRVSNMNLVWVDSDTNGQSFEFIAEQ